MGPRKHQRFILDDREDGDVSYRKGEIGWGTASLGSSQNTHNIYQLFAILSINRYGL